jgi:hypothetical protein
MTMKTIVPSPKAKHAARSEAAAETAIASPTRRSRTSTGKRTKTPTAVDRTGDTKHARLLFLLGQPAGASIDDMIKATDWQQHSVRGFLAGTVKKKLGLELTSSKSDGEARRYRIVVPQGR